MKIKKWNKINNNNHCHFHCPSILFPTMDLSQNTWLGIRTVVRSSQANTINENCSTVEFLGVVHIFAPKNTWKTNNFLPSFEVPCLDLQITLPQIFFYSQLSTWTSRIYSSKWTCVWAKFLMAIHCNMQQLLYVLKIRHPFGIPRGHIFSAISGYKFYQ